MPIFTNPLALAGLAAIPVLVGIYFLHRRYRPVPVSSLMLWLDPRTAREGGSRVERLRTPLLFYLELAALALFALAAAGPQVPAAQRARPLVVVLDDSFSMLAGEPDSPRARARKALEEELRQRSRPSVRFVLAGDRPQTLGDPAHSTQEALERLDAWHCRAPAAQLDEAITLAGELGGELALLLVLTDHPPETVPGKGRVQWWAFGKALPNFAFVNAARSARDGVERCLLEIANLSDQPRAPHLTIEPGVKLDRPPPELQPREVYRVVFQLDGDAPAIRARLGDDALAIDNQLTLLPVRPRPVRVTVDVADASLRKPLEKALSATRSALVRDERPDIRFSDRDDDAISDAWRVRLVADKDANVYAGPFIIDRNHPLAEGLSLQGVVWGAGKSSEVPGAPVILAGNVPLITDVERPGGSHEVRLRLRPDLSTLQDTPAWPVLVYNLLQWSQAQAPGLSRPNVRLGEEAVLTLARQRETVEVATPSGQVFAVAVSDRRAALRGEEVGTYEFRSPDNHSVLGTVAVNALNRDESDLSECTTSRWGDWMDETSLRMEYQSISWLLLLIALGVVTVHLVFAVRGGQ